MSLMLWSLVLAASVMLACVGTILINGLRFKRRVLREERTLLALCMARVSTTESVTLPAPVARYKTLALANHSPVKTLRLQHHGTFSMSASAKPAKIKGHQLFTADPPGFVWTGRIHLWPGVWVDARDMYANGVGNMRVLLSDTLPIANAKGAEIDQGSALRLLAEMAWYPSAFFDARWVTWTAIDATHARATLQTGRVSVTAVFEFGADGLLCSVLAERFMDKTGLKPWGGTYRDWRTVSGMRVPYDVDVWWLLDNQRFTYAHWIVDALRFDAS